MTNERVVDTRILVSRTRSTLHQIPQLLLSSNNNFLTSRSNENSDRIKRIEYPLLSIQCVLFCESLSTCSAFARPNVLFRKLRQYSYLHRRDGDGGSDRISKIANRAKTKHLFVRKKRILWVTPMFVDRDENSLPTFNFVTSITSPNMSSERGENTVLTAENRKQIVRFVMRGVWPSGTGHPRLWTLR